VCTILQNIERSYGAIIYNNKISKVLLINFLYKNKIIWGFPKGHAEKDETGIQAAKREVLEETGLNIIINSNFQTKTNFTLQENGKTRNREVIYYAGFTENTVTTAQHGEITSCKWCDINTAENLLTFDCDKEILKKFIDFLKNRPVLIP